MLSPSVRYFIMNNCAMRYSSTEIRARTSTSCSLSRFANLGPPYRDAFNRTIDDPSRSPPLPAHLPRIGTSSPSIGRQAMSPECRARTYARYRALIRVLSKGQESSLEAGKQHATIQFIVNRRHASLRFPFVVFVFPASGKLVHIA